MNPPRHSEKPEPGLNDGEGQRRRLVGVALAAAVLVSYSLLGQCRFLEWDDPDYVTANDAIQHGVNGASLRWAFTTFHASNWHPLTWISHTVDYALFGGNAAGHHWMSALLHAANAILVFLCLTRMTGRLWRSAAAAGFFALHPLRVESVAWISERKDVLSGLFGLLAVWAYIRFAEAAKAEGPRRRWFFGLALFWFALGLMAKPMLVTLPCALLLLDAWPLGRLEGRGTFPGRTLARLAWEKAPFFALSIASSIVTVMAQREGGAVKSLLKYPLATRLENMPVAYVRYLEKTFWPASLSIFYPLPMSWPAWAWAGSTALLIVITILAARQWRRRPYWITGWLWFTGMLIPTIGLAQVGEQAMADRYTYLPSIGLWWAVVWGASDAAAGRAAARKVLAVTTAAALLACAALTYAQVGYWQDTVMAFTHAAEVTKGNYLADYNLGCYYGKIGENAKAIDYFKQTIAARPGIAVAYNNLAYLLLEEGKIDEAITNLELAVRSRPAFAEAWMNLGRAWAAKGESARAEKAFEKSLELDPNAAETRYRFGDLLMQEGKAGEAAAQYRRALEARPDSGPAAAGLERALKIINTQAGQ